MVSRSDDSGLGSGLDGPRSELRFFLFLKINF
jgi:hypothetical protein